MTSLFKRTQFLEGEVTSRFHSAPKQESTAAHQLSGPDSIVLKRQAEASIGKCCDGLNANLIQKPLRVTQVFFASRAKLAVLILAFTSNSFRPPSPFGMAAEKPLYLESQT